MLIFADNATFGLKLGSNTAANGGSVTLGYKNHSVAIVPMSVLDDTGNAKQLSSLDEGARDAISVFAVFDASGQGRTSPINTGQMFSTGVAAQQLTRGYLCRSHPQAAQCAASGPAAAVAQDGGASASDKLAAKSALAAASSAVAAAASAKSAAASASVAARVPKLASGQNDTTPSSDPYQWPLVFGRTDVLGFDIAGSASEQGASFVLGLGIRNLALVPTYSPNRSGQVTGGLYANSEEIAQDAFSVLGQFSASTKTTELGFGIERYFATGIAAQNLSRAIAAAVAASAPKQGARVAPAAASAATVPQRASAPAGGQN